ncbi:stAR-related lipid transfer protein 5 [Microcaecilia unicolor]|uniref:StAR-related lipid transfer protein 5 n=1 Tax=Microcaecilia unicolor TaxID=1415580 RepID=A0A6P7WWG8_9AMPH|nr:stAR-related lipid transfer protein 5 [Microcaecilia unicolor]
MDYLELARAAAAKVLSYSRERGGWRLCKSTDEVCIYWRPSSEFPGNVYKGEGIVNTAPEHLWEYLKPEPGGLRVKWDKTVKEFEVIEAVTDTLSVCRTVTPAAAMKIISPRDFVDVVLINQYEDGTIASSATNVQHPSCPPQPGYVRGLNHPCGCLCIPAPGDPGKTQLVSVFQTDLSGCLPQSVVDSFFPFSMAQFYTNLIKAVRTQNI